MQHTFHITDTSDPAAKAFMAYIRTLSFIREDTSADMEYALSQENIEILEERRNDRLEGKSQVHSWEDVQNFVKSRKTK